MVLLYDRTSRVTNYRTVDYERQHLLFRATPVGLLVRISLLLMRVYTLHL